MLDSRRLVLIIILLIAVAYLNSLSVYFIWDDYSSVVSNANIRSLSLRNIFKPLYSDDSSNIAKTPLYYRPLQVLSYIFDYRVWKLNPFGYHITNIILHTANALLLYLLLLLLFKDRVLAFCGSSLFGIHPVFTSSVTYISGRTDILSLFFLLAMLIAFIKSIEGSKLKTFFYCLSLFCSFLLLLSKEIGMLGILFLITLDKLILKYSVTKIRNLIYAPFILVFLSWQYLRPSAAPGFHTAVTNPKEILLGFLTLLKGLGIYTLLAIIPFQMRMGRSIAVISTLQDKWVYVSLAFLIVIIALYILGLRKNKQAVFGLIWFYLPLFILLFFNYLFGKRGNEILLPEHNLYFCYIGLLIFVFSIIGGLKFQDNAKKYLAATFLFFLVFYGGLTISENFIWHDEVRFFERNIKRNQDSVFNFVAYSNLGFAYERKEKFKQAEESFRLAAQRSQGNPYFYNTLATFYIRNKDFDRALKTLMFSLELDKNFYNTYFLLGIVYANKGNAIEARRNFEKALLLNPSDSTSKRYLEALSQK